MSWNGEKLQGCTRGSVSRLELREMEALVFVIQLEKTKEVWRNGGRPNCVRMQRWHWLPEQLRQRLCLLPLAAAQNESQYMTSYSHLVLLLDPKTSRLLVFLG